MIPDGDSKDLVLVESRPVATVADGVSAIVPALVAAARRQRLAALRRRHREREHPRTTL
jgi:hypothetical protein